MKVKIRGIGRYLPIRIIKNEELEKDFGIKPGSLLHKCGLTERRRADPYKETQSWMAAQAFLGAVKDAGLHLNDIQLIVNASGTPERAIPDNGPLIQDHLGLSTTGIPAFSIHATCLSFLVALEVVSSMIHSGVYDNVLVVSSEVVSPFSLDFKKDPYTAGLFGDCAVAVVLSKTPPSEASALTLWRMETFGDFKELATLKGGGSRFHPADPKTTSEHQTFSMNGPGIMEFAVDQIPPFMERLKTGLSEGLGSIQCVIAHQPSGHGMDYLQHGLNWGDKVVRVFDTFGNGISTSIPNALYEALEQGKVKRGDEIMVCGTGAGLSMAAAILIY